MDLLYDYLTTHPVVYVTRDIERALALSLPVRGYYIITNKTTEALKHEKLFPKNILLIANKEKLLDTNELLAHKDAKRFIDGLLGPDILVFKNTLQIEKIAKDNKWSLLNPSALFANRIEEKIEQVTWLREYAGYLPPHSISTLKDVSFKNTPFILQFNHAHSGEGTILIKSKENLEALQKLFPDREVRKSDYIEGPVFTGNNVVTSERTLLGNINYQITGIAPFTDIQFGTVGNDFSFPLKKLSQGELSQYKKIVEDIGEKMRLGGWRGLFGIDFVVSSKTGRVYLIEINARQPAGTTFESKLQNDERKKKKIGGLTVFEAHLMSLFGLPFKDTPIIPLIDGAQIVKRVTKASSSVSPQALLALAEAGLDFILYENTKENSELVRIQSPKGIIKEHGELNPLGNKIVSIIENSI